MTGQLSVLQDRNISFQHAFTDRMQHVFFEKYDARK